MPAKTVTVKIFKSLKTAPTKIHLLTNTKEISNTPKSPLDTWKDKTWHSCVNMKPSNLKSDSLKHKTNNLKPKSIKLITKNPTFKNNSNKNSPLNKNPWFSSKNKKTTNFNSFKSKAKRTSQNSDVNTNSKSMNSKSNLKIPSTLTDKKSNKSITLKFAHLNWKRNLKMSKESWSSQDKTTQLSTKN